jgi:hypothetical protein
VVRLTLDRTLTVTLPPWLTKGTYTAIITHSTTEPVSMIMGLWWGPDPTK